MKLLLLTEQLKAYLEQPLRTLKFLIGALSTLVLLVCGILSPVITIMGLLDIFIFSSSEKLIFLFIFAISIFLFGCFSELRFYQFFGMLAISIAICLTVETYYM